MLEFSRSCYQPQAGLAAHCLACKLQPGHVCSIRHAALIPFGNHTPHSFAGAGAVHAMSRPVHLHFSVPQVRLCLPTSVLSFHPSLMSCFTGNKHFCRSLFHLHQGGGTESQQPCGKLPATTRSCKTTADIHPSKGCLILPSAPSPPLCLSCHQADSSTCP